MPIGRFKRFLTLQLFIITLLLPIALACYNHSSNICNTGTNICNTITGRYTFDDGSEIGVQSNTLTHEDMTIGCYCQYSDTTFYGGSTPTYARHPKSTSVLLTTCNLQLNAWWDGVNVMNTTGGTLGGEDNSGYSIEYNEFYCAQSLASDGEAPSSANGPFNLIEWKTDPSLPLEVTLPSNVMYFDGDQDKCPGVDVTTGMFINQNRASTLTSSDIQNCSCQSTSHTYDAGTGLFNDYGDNTFWTVCSKSFGVYFNGLGWRTVRTSGDVTDECHQPDPTAAIRLTYVTTRRGKSSSATSNIFTGYLSQTIVSLIFLFAIFLLF